MHFLVSKAHMFLYIDKFGEVSGVLCGKKGTIKSLVKEIEKN